MGQQRLVQLLLSVQFLFLLSLLFSEQILHHSVLGGVSATATSVRPRSRVPWTVLPASSTPNNNNNGVGKNVFVRGGAEFQHSSPTTTTNNNNKNATVEEYVAAVEEKDAQHRTNSSGHDDVGESDEKATTDPEKNTIDHDSEASTTDSRKNVDPTVGVGVKSHHSKKSNAVGDPDDDDSDDDDDDDTENDISSSEDEWEDVLLDDFVGDNAEEDPSNRDLGMFVEQPSTELQVEVEVVEDDEELEEMDNEDEQTKAAKASGGGGVARLGQRIAGRRKSKNTKHDWRTTNTDSKGNVHSSRHAAAAHEQMIQAWLPHVYLPPSPDALAYLIKNARLLDSSSKIRLDRRTLYSGLLLEWLNESPSNRKFLDSSTSQALQAALSLATQPQWRRSFPRPSAVRLFENEVGKSCTLAMQETIVMALAHSLGAGMVILDDEVLSSVREKLVSLGYANEDIKPAALVRALLDAAKEGGMNQKVGGSIAKCMTRDLSLGLDDPHDERAANSCEDMDAWEEVWHDETTTDQDSDVKDKPMPLVLFIRTQSAHSILKSKSAVDSILKECNTDESVNLIVLGDGIDARTLSLPKNSNLGGSNSGQPDNNFIRDNQQMQNGIPFFGFTQQNQNASGQNDPPGSRRFNIFLARTLDANGVPGILGAIAPPQAGNLFPHMMAMQARGRMQQNADSPAKAELERWSQLLLQQMQHTGQNSDTTNVQPPQFFNASLASPFGDAENSMFSPNSQPPPQEVIQRTLEHALSELLDRLSEMNDDGEPAPTSPAELSPDLHKAFAQVLRNESIRRGIADNLARAAPALADPKCQGVMLSVYVPPPQKGNGKQPGSNGNNRPQSNVGGWFKNILNNQEAADAAADAEGDSDESRRKKARQKRARTMAAYHAVMTAKNAQDSKEGNGNDKQEKKAERNLARLESLCRPIPIKVPSDPVRAKSWDGWIARERGAVVFRQNRMALNKELRSHNLSLQQHTGTRGAGSSLRQMLSVRDMTEEMDEVIKCAVELEAAKGQRLHETPDEIHEKEMDLGVDITLGQLLTTDDDESIGEYTDLPSGSHNGLKYLHPSSLETALSITCRVSPSPSGGLSLNSSPASHRSREEIATLAQDKHERALISQVVSPQDIGVTYDMIGGLTDVKELLRQSITYPLKFPHLYSEGIAREAVKGVLLFGPPGTGKTMLAKAVATEGGASFLSVDASSVENKWLGESEKNAKAVFTLARRLAPCVIFIDEVDSLLSSREGTSDDSAHGTLTSVKTTMMSEWDGLNSGTNGSGEAGSDRVVVIGSTNRPFDLDEAVLRRFPRRILVDLPDLETRKEILEVTLAENRLDPDVNLTAIAERLEGYTGSDIKEVCREAVVQISHEQAKLLDQGVVNNSREDVTQGSLQRLRPVNVNDFDSALSKLKRSVSEKGRELARVWEWNDEYGEIKKEKKNHLPHLMSMYL